MNADLSSAHGSVSGSGSRRRELFLQASQLPDPRQRAAFLDTTCGQGTALRRELDELLIEQDQLGDFLEQPAFTQVLQSPNDSAAAWLSTSSALEKPGDRIGRYRLIHKMGEGGCGVVYRAVQEAPVRREVALKIIKLGMDTQTVISRFEAERQALAMMNHPNIARVFDAGSTETGRPFFVMELVDGMRLTEFCTGRQLPLEERLRLFIQVCEAIQHAHQKGVIHRDIKPSNILAAEAGGATLLKVIDFGIAKATEQRLTDHTFVTELRAFVGTPAYMSPEQAQMGGLDIDTRADIYALGVLLYELLTGAPPFESSRFVRAGLDECRRIIREEEPVPPSRRLNLLGTHPFLPLSGDLDWIVLKCLDKDRTRRYATANDLALDVQRFLENEPVLARPPSALYRVEKFAKRHRMALGAAAAIAATLLAAAVVSSWLAVRARQAEKRAQAAQLKEARLREVAENQRQLAERERAQAKLNEYVADINLADQALAAGNYGRAVQLLEKHLPEPGQTDRRGFAWHYLWSLSRGDEHTAVSPPHQGSIFSIAISPDSALFAVASRESITIRDRQSQSVVATLGVGAVGAAFSPDGNYFCAGNERQAIVWETSTWKELQRFDGRSAPLVFSPDGKQLILSSRAGLRFYETAGWLEVDSLPEAYGPVAIAPDGETLASDSREGICLWTLGQNNNPKRLLENSANLLGGWLSQARILQFSPDGKYLVAPLNHPSSKGVFVLNTWDARTGKDLGPVPAEPDVVEHTGVISSLSFSLDGQFLAAGSWDHSIRLWDLRRGKRVAKFQGHLNEVWAVAFAPDGRTLISGSKDAQIKIWDALGKSSRPVPPSGVPLAISRRNILALAAEATVDYVDLNTMETVQQFPLERNGFRFFPVVSVSADLRWMAAVENDRQVRVRDTEKAESYLIALAGEGPYFASISPDGAILVTVGRDRTLRWWDVKERKEISSFQNAERAVFSPDGSMLAVASRAGIQIWNAATRAEKAQLTRQENLGFTMTFSPDSKMLAVTTQPFSTENAIHLFDTGTGELIGTCTGHKQTVGPVAFSPDGKTLASAGSDSAMKLWNLSTRQELLTIRKPGRNLHGLLFSPDGQLLIGGGHRDASARLELWRAPIAGDRP